MLISIAFLLAVAGAAYLGAKYGSRVREKATAIAFEAYAYGHADIAKSVASIRRVEKLLVAAVKESETDVAEKRAEARAEIHRIVSEVEQELAAAEAFVVREVHKVEDEAKAVVAAVRKIL